MSFHVRVLTLFPEYFDSPLNSSILSRARRSEILDFDAINIRDFATDKHRSADDMPYGGGAGMVMKPEPIAGAMDSISLSLPRIFLSPQGTPLTHSLAKELSTGPGFILLCGHYEGVDQRIRDHYIDLEISIGDFVLTGGEPAALVLIDAVTRLIPEVLGNADSLSHESFTTPLLDFPQYTRPRDFQGHQVPEVLLSGNHGKIEAWRNEKRLEKTQDIRPDLLKKEKLASET